MWAAFKLLPAAVKIGVLVAILASLAAFGFVMYREGLNTAAVKVAVYEGKVSALNTALTQANARTTLKIVPEYIRVTDTIRETTAKNVGTIKNAVPNQGFMSQGWINAYNQTVLGKPIDFDLAKIATSSRFSDNEALQRIALNNGKCLANAEQLNALSIWVKEVYENGQKVSSTDIK